MPELVLIYGPPLSGKSALAREVAGRLGEKAALVSVDGLLRDSIVKPDPDAHSELEMVHTQARLMVANYLKNRYHVVLEGAFYYERDGELFRYEQEIDQTMALMRNLARTPLVVRLSIGEPELRRRAAALGRAGDAAVSLRIGEQYKPRYGAMAMELADEGGEIGELAEKVVGRLEEERIA